MQSLTYAMDQVLPTFLGGKCAQLWGASPICVKRTATSGPEPDSKYVHYRGPVRVPAGLVLICASCRRHEPDSQPKSI